MGRSHERQLTIPAPPEAVAQRAREVISRMPKVTGVIMTPPTVQAKVGMGALSWGEKITVTLQPIDGGTGVHIRSQCAFPLQLVDYGKNKKNVESIAAGLAP
ncbi:MAG: hypothetical protein ACK5MR_05850 [Cumulibacter sp.]